MWQIVGDDTKAIDSVLSADVWRDRLMSEERDLNTRLQVLEGLEAPDKSQEIAREEAVTRLAEVHASLADIEAESGPARAAQLLSGSCIQHYVLRSSCFIVSQQGWALAKKTNIGQRALFLAVGECALPSLVLYSLSQICSCLASQLPFVQYIDNS